MAEEQRNVIIRLKRGAWEIEITCSPERVQQAVESVLAGMSSREATIVTVEGPETDKEKKFGTCRGLLLTLWNEGWFGSPRQLSEVDDELAKRGYHYDRTAVAHSLVDLVREGNLFREGSMRNYRYVQKFPPAKAQAGAGEG